MDSREFNRLFREAEAKLGQGGTLNRQEQLIVLAGLLMAQATRKEKRYGQA